MRNKPESIAPLTPPQTPSLTHSTQIHKHTKQNKTKQNKWQTERAVARIKELLADKAESGGPPPLGVRLGIRRREWGGFGVVCLFHALRCSGGGFEWMD
jgi:hypothetical protein